MMQFMTVYHLFIKNHLNLINQVGTYNEKMENSYKLHSYFTLYIYTKRKHNVNI